MLGKRKS